MGQNPNKRYVQGSFYDKNGYYFLMSKYELMKGQYDALTDSSKCKAPNKMSRLPAVKYLILILSMQLMLIQFICKS